MHQPLSNRATARGFTLIEVMVVVAIVAILAALALPSYREHVARGRRADAKAMLLEAAQWVERQYTITRTYASNAAGAAMDNDVLDAAPLSSRTSVSPFYTLTYGNAAGDADPTATTFSLRVTPTGAMTGDKCGSFIIDNTGARTIATTSTSTAAECWGR